MYCHRTGDDDTTDELEISCGKFHATEEKFHATEVCPSSSSTTTECMLTVALLLVRDKLFTNCRCPRVLVEAIATQCCCMLKSKAASSNPVLSNTAI